MIKKSRIFLKGLNYFGQFGFDTELDYNKNCIEFKDLYNIEIKKFDANISQSYYLLNNGEFYYCGWIFDNYQCLKILNNHDRYPQLMNFLRNYKISNFHDIKELTLINNEEGILDFTLVGLGAYFYNYEYLFAIGENSRKQLSMESKVLLNPEEIIDLRINVSNIKNISGSDQHSFINLKNGLTLASGACNYYQYISKEQIKDDIENNKKNFDNILKEIEVPGETIEKISTGFTHSIFLTKSNKLFACGNNSWNQWGISNDFTFLLKKYIKINLDLDKNEKILDIKSGNSHNLYLTSKNRLFFFGSNKKNQFLNTSSQYSVEFYSNIEINLNFLEQDEYITKIEAKYNISGILTNHNRAFIWGDDIDNFESLGFEGKIIDFAFGLRHTIIKTEV